MKLLTALALLLTATLGHAAAWFAAAGTTVSTNLAYAVIPAGARAQFVSAVSDSSAGTLKFYSCQTGVTVTNALAAGMTNVMVSATNGIAAGGVVVIRGVSGDQYQRALVYSVSAAGGIVITNSSTAAPTSFALVSGDKVYPTTAAYSETIGATAKSLSSGGVIWVAPVDKPALIELSATGVTTNQSLIVSGSMF